MTADDLLERAAREAGLDREVMVTSRPEDVLSADHVVLPGVGHSPHWARPDAIVDAIEDVATRTAAEVRG